MLKVLVADDSTTDREIIETMLADMGHHSLIVDNGAALLTAFDQFQPDIVLLDVIMPIMNGLETARQIKAKSGEYFVPVIFLTSLDQDDFIEQCLDAGGDDFLSKPVNPRVLRAKMLAFERMQTMQNSLIAHRNQLSQHHQQIVNEQSIAKHVYDAITGKGQLDCGTIRYHMSSHAIFNGDVLLASIRPNGNLMVLLGDFTGHGLPAALGAIPLASSFYNMIATGFSQTDILRELNEKMHAMLPRGLFCCAFCIEVDFTRQQLSVWNGGQPTGYFLPHDQQKPVPLPSTSLPLGIDIGEKFSEECTQLNFTEQDRLIIWTDGIFDSRNAQGERFNQNHLNQLMEDLPPGDKSQFFDKLLNLVRHHLGEDQNTDDISLVEILTQQPAASSEVITQSKIVKGPLDWQFEFEIKPPTFRSFDPIPALMTLLTQVPGLGSKATSLFTVLTELYTNAVDHGLLGLSSLQKSCGNSFTDYYQERDKKLARLQTGYVKIRLHLFTMGNSGRLQVVVEDSGPGFDYENEHKPEVEKLLHGRGIELVRQFCQSLTYEGRGNIAKAVYVWSLNS